MEWHCLVCDKLLPTLFPEDDSEGVAPNLDGGGFFSFDFGYGSRRDSIDRDHIWQGCICDDCLTIKLHRVRRVKSRLRRYTIWEPVPLIDVVQEELATVMPDKNIDAWLDAPNAVAGTTPRQAIYSNPEALVVYLKETLASLRDRGDKDG